MCLDNILALYSAGHSAKEPGGVLSETKQDTVLHTDIVGFTGIEKALLKATDKYRELKSKA